MSIKFNVKIGRPLTALKGWSHPQGVFVFKGKYIIEHFYDESSNKDLPFSISDYTEYKIEFIKHAKAFDDKKVNRQPAFIIIKDMEQYKIIGFFKYWQMVYLKIIFCQYWWTKEKNIEKYIFPIVMLILGYLFGRWADC